MTTAFRAFPCLRFERMVFLKTRVNIIEEKELLITLNGSPLATASLTPGMEKEFVAGYIFSQGFADAASRWSKVAPSRSPRR